MTIVEKLVEGLRCCGSCEPYEPTPKMLDALSSGVVQMQSAGCEFTDEQIDILTQGELLEQELVYKSYLGGDLVNCALNAIFDNDEGYLDMKEVVH